MSRKEQIKRLKQLEKRHKSGGFHDPDQQNLDTYDFGELPEDRQYDRMLAEAGKPHKKVKRSDANSELFFESDPKYKAKKATKPEPNEEEFINGEDNLDEDFPQMDSATPEEENEMATTFKQLRKKNKLDTHLLDKKLREINEEDEQVLHSIQAAKDVTEEESVHLRNQFDLYKKLVELRYHFEKTFQSVKRLPTINYAPKDATLESKNNELKQVVTGNLDNCLSLYEELASKTQSTQTHINMDIDDVELLYEHYRSSTEAAHKAVEKSIIKWSNKTALLSQISQSNYTSLLMQTPIGQAGKVLTSLDKVLPKSRLKRSVFRQLFAPPEDIKQTTNDQIFDDFDLFHQLEKQFEEEVIKDEDGLLLSASKKYLQERNSKSQADRKEVDRKASKNRKLRFDVHAKLVNFMAGQDNPYVIEARDEILRNLFNSGGKGDEQPVDYIDM